MTIDLSQFYEVFIDESLEGLDIMEKELLGLSVSEPSSESINTIFRAAHSIKGGSGTFGFDGIARFTHVVETLLDEVRHQQRTLTSQIVDLLLQAVDCLRELIGAIENGQEGQSERVPELKAQFDQLLASNEPAEVAVSEQPSSAPSQVYTLWQIIFTPQSHLFKTGNEPLFIFDDLAALGSISVAANFEHLPSLAELEAEDCFLSWTISLDSYDATESQIRAVFEWVEDDADIHISQKAQIEDFEAIPVAADSVSGDDSIAPIANPVTNDTKPVKPAAPVKKNSDDGNKAETGSIRVGIDKVDSLINMVGELVITQAMLSELGESDDFGSAKQTALKEGLAQLAQHTRELQENVMRIRMLPISFVFSRFPRLVRDISQKLNKLVDLKLLGEQTELDKTVMEKISDPLVHLVRNSLDHGVESPEQRIAAGKPEVGTVTLNAYHQGGNIIIEIIDDGRGLNTEKIKQKAIAQGLISGDDTALSDVAINELIFHPGFSTADEVSDLSGRGVGMDVVKRNISELNGSIDVESVPGQGTTFTIRLPLTLAIVDGQLIRVGRSTYIVPLIAIVESLQVNASHVRHVAGGLDVLRLRDEYIPILRLCEIFNHPEGNNSLDRGLLVVVEFDNEKVGLLVDELLAQQQFVIKSLEANYQKVEGISGATILGDGSVSLIIDITGIVKLAGLKHAGKQGLEFNEPLSEAM